jgi:hypothetical protein
MNTEKEEDKKGQEEKAEKDIEQKKNPEQR